MLIRLPLLCVLFVMTIMSTNLISKTQESQDILLEDSSSKSISGGGSDAMVNSIPRDPFYRVLDQTSWDNTAITDYELNDLSLIGVVWDVPKPLAMFRAPKDKRFLLIAGDRIGKNDGVIMEISKGEVHVREIYTDINGSKTEKSTIKRVEKRV